MRPAAAATVAEPVSITDPSQLTPLAILGGLLVVLVAAYWDMFSLISAAWNEGLYSHGWIVPLFALALLWLRWTPFGPVPAHERWIGVGLIAVGLSARLLAAEYAINPLDRLSFLPSIFGIFMLVGGMHVVRWAWPALLFLVFMFPLPTALEVSVLNRLQKLATIASTFVLQTLGVSAFRTGNLISIPGMETPLNVAEGCSGLRMATIFAALAVAMVFVIERPWWDKFVILLSAIPIALIVNIVRITVTALLYIVAGPKNRGGPKNLPRLCRSRDHDAARDGAAVAGTPDPRTADGARRYRATPARGRCARRRTDAGPLIRGARGLKNGDKR